MASVRTQKTSLTASTQAAKELDSVSSRMEFGDSEETLKAVGSVGSCISRVKWRLKPSTRRRLEKDILALCTGLRAVVLVDYGGMMPELQEHICALLGLLRKESAILLPLRAMVIEDMIYIMHVKGLAELASSSLSLDHHFSLVDLEQDPPKLQMLHVEENLLTSELLITQKLFSSLFPVDVDIDLLPVVPPPMVKPTMEQSESKDVDLTLISGHSAFQPSVVVDLSSILHDQISLPTLNGWLLGYPVVYLLRKASAEDAIYNLSTKSLHIYKIFIHRNQIPNTKSCEEELMSFTVPCDLSLKREKEPWAEAFLGRMLAKFERCRHVWASMRLEVTECFTQAVVL